MIHKRNPKPPTMVPLRSKAGQRELRQCECCWKVQSIGEGYEIRRKLCRQCAAVFDGFDGKEEVALATETVGGSVAYTIRPSLWYRFKSWFDRNLCGG